MNPPDVSGEFFAGFSQLFVSERWAGLCVEVRNKLKTKMEGYSALCGIAHFGVAWVQACATAWVD